MTVRGLLGSLDSRELTEWRAYELETGPLGSERLDFLFARLAATYVRTAADPKKVDRIKDEHFRIKWSGGGGVTSGDDS